MKKFTEIREARRSAQDRLSARAAKHGLGSKKRLDKIKKASDFFSKPPPSFSKAELKKMGYAVEASSPAQQAAIAIAKKANKVVNAEESSKVPSGMKFIASYVYKDANGKDHTHRHLRKGTKMTDPVVVYIDDKEWKTFQSFTKAKQAAIAHIKGIREMVEKTLTPAEKKKREEIAKAIERDNPDMPMAKKMAIATSTAKRVTEGKNDYPIYHKTYSGAMQAAYAFAKKKGFEVDKTDIDDKVATGPKKPSSGKTNSFTLKLVGQKNKRLAVQVTNLDNRRYELNCYIT